jgi:hypothetical protein
MTRRTHRNGLDEVAQEPSRGEGMERPWRKVLEFSVERGLGGLAESVQRLVNEAMNPEHSMVLGVRPYQRTLDRAQLHQFIDWKRHYDALCAN